MGLNEFGAERISSRPLEFIWIIDVSTSMKYHGKDKIFNDAVRSCIPQMRDVASNNVSVDVLVRVLTFGTEVKWTVKDRTPLEKFEWKDLQPKGQTNLGKALLEISNELSIDKMPKRGMPPVLILVTDGAPGDNYKKPLKKLLSQPWGKKAVKIAIGIGEKVKKDVLIEFIDNPEIQPLYASNASELVDYIKWASTRVLESASTTNSQLNPDIEISANVDIAPYYTDETEIKVEPEEWKVDNFLSKDFQNDDVF